MDSAVQQKTVVMDSPEDIALADKMNVAKQKIIGELSKLIVGQEQVVHQVLLTLFVGATLPAPWFWAPYAASPR